MNNAANLSVNTFSYFLFSTNTCRNKSEQYSIAQMLEFYFGRYPYGASKDQILKNLTEFEYADNDADPNCLRGKYWDLIKLDFIELLEY